MCSSVCRACICKRRGSPSGGMARALFCIEGAGIFCLRARYWPFSHALSKSADRIAVPSTQVVESFAPWPEHACKLFLSPYGVDLVQFPLRSGNLPSEPTVLFVGNWSYQKGVDVLMQAIGEMDGVRLIHVGALVDAPFPNHLRFVHHEPVPQWKLKCFYGAAHAFVLASRQDGCARC